MAGSSLLDGLRELSDTAFPRKCANCGREYMSFGDFIEQTRPLEGRSGLIENQGCPEEGDEVIVELYRNCICGSTLMEFFTNRRDTSDKGVHRRALFERLLGQLIAEGISDEEARAELTAFMRYGRSSLFEELGLQIEIE